MTPCLRLLLASHSIAFASIQLFAQGGASLDYTVSWIGNSFPGGDTGWVPQDVQDIFVAPDGTVFTTTTWEEHRGNIAAFKDGRLLAQTAHWKAGGIDRLVGDSITANSAHIFFATGRKGPGDHDGKAAGTFLARRDRADIAARQPERRVELGVQIRGVAASETRVFAACADDRMRVFDVELNPIVDWPVKSPGEIAVDADGSIWVIHTDERAVRRYDPVGNQLPQAAIMPDGVIPTDVAVAPDGRLLIADGGKNRQIRIYRNPASTPELETTMGEPGGAFSGPVPGRFGDQRFIAPIGTGADAFGNIYVACGPYQKHHGGTAIIQSYGKERQLNWRVMSTEWLDTVDADREADGNILYGSKYRYSLDLSKPPGHQWRVEAITLNPDLHPDDPRLKTAALGGVWHRWIQGRRYLYIPDMNGGMLCVFRFDPAAQGETAIFCAQISTKSLWIDRNGNARTDEGETVPNETGETRGWFVDDAGTIWQATRGNGIFEYPLDNFLPGGIPVYSTGTRKTYPAPAPFTELRRIVYDRSSDTMFLGGSTREARAEHWKPMGPNLACYHQWTAGAQLAWHELLPHEKGKGGHESYEPFDFAVEGAFVFVVNAGRLPSRNYPTGTVMVFDRSTGRFRGHMQPSGTRTGAVPMDALQDMVHSLNVHQRKDGEYIIFIEDDGYTKNLFYRWKP